MKKILLLLLLISFKSNAQRIWNPQTLSEKVSVIVPVTETEKDSLFELYKNKEQSLWNSKLASKNRGEFDAGRKAIFKDFSRKLRILLGARRYRVWRKRLADERAGIKDPLDY